MLAAETHQDMEDWITALKSAKATSQFYEGADQVHSLLSGKHNWYATSHARPTYCNVCREALSGVTSHGLSCEVCKMKAHKRCATKALNNCKWTTLASVGKDIIEDDEGNLAMPHQWLEGNLPVSAKCAVCEKTCGSVLRLQDWRCLWCRAMVHTACRPLHPNRCPLGLCRISIVPPTALTTIGTDEAWEVTRPQNCSPLLVFVNSKSGDNQGVRFLRRFKQLLNPAQVFDLMNGGPSLGLRLFKCFNPFRILICSGDGSVGWVLSEIDKLHMTNQCQIGVLPLGTGNDLARVLGWGSACDDDTNLPHILEKYERATTKMLDRWSIMSYVSHVSLSPEHKLDSLTSPSLLSQVAAYEDSVGAHLATLLQSDQHSDVISSAKVLCETIKSLIMKVGKSWRETSGTAGEVTSADVGGGVDDSLSAKCMILNDKLDLLLRALREESIASMSSVSTNTQEESSGVDESPETSLDLDSEEKVSLCKEEKNSSNTQHRKRHKRKHFIEKEALMSRANSLKKAVREIIEHTERALDDQNEQTAARQPPPTIKLQLSEDEEMQKIYSDHATGPGLQVLPTIAASSSEASPCPSPVPVKGLSPFVSSITTNFPLPPASPLPFSAAAQHLHSLSGTENQQLTHPTFLQIPGSGSPPGTDDPIEQLRVEYQCISPLPDLRRESQNEFEFPPTLPVPSEFADLSRKNSMQEPRDVGDGSCIAIEDIEVRIQSSTDNLVDVGDDDEPYAFEEKSISEIRDSLASSLNNSVDIDEDWEEVRREENDTEHGDAEEEMADEGVDGEDEDKEKTETADSDETDDTVRETQRCESKEGGNLEDTSPEGDASVAEATSANSISDHDGEEKRSGSSDLGTRSPEGDLPFGEETHPDATTPTVPLAEEELLENLEEEEDPETVPPSSERFVEGAEAGSDEEHEEEKGEDTTRRISTGSTFKSPGGDITSLSITSSTSGKDKAKSSDRGGKGPTGRGTGRGSAAARSRKHLPIINPLVSLPMWPNIAAGAGSGGLISKVLLANADALCAAASPLMDIDDSCLDGYEERCTMNNYFGIGIDAKITLDFHNKREEHPEKCRSRTKNFMWYGVLASKEWLCKTYKNLDQRVQLECDGERIPLPSLQGIVVLNIPSFMGGTNFWGGTKEDDCFLAPSFDDRILEVVAVFGSAQMAASRIINLQHHRIAQCSSIKITILGEAGEEGVPIQVDGEAWTQPPGIVRIVHKNRVQMLCRNRDLEVSLKAWEEMQRSSGNQTKQPTLLADEELPVLAVLASTVGDVISSVHLAAVNTPSLENHLGDLASSATMCLEKIWRDGKVIESPNLRMLATELVTNVRSLHSEISIMLKDETSAINQAVKDILQGALSHLDGALKHVQEKDSLMHFFSEEEGDRKPPHSKGLFKIKLKREGRKGGLEREVRDWGPDEVAAWLDGLNLTEYKESFIGHDIRGSELLNLERRDLKELGVTKIGHIKRIQQAIREIKDSKSHS